MSQLQFRVLLRWCHRALLVLGLVGAARFGYVAWRAQPKTVTYTPVPQNISSSSNRTEPDVSRGIRQNLLESLALKPAPLPSELLQLGIAPSIAASAAPKKPPVTRIYLAVHQGPPRSEIRLNGIALGQTPFVGEITCKHGEPLEFVLIPPKGLPRRSQHICDRTEITIADKPHNP